MMSCTSRDQHPDHGPYHHRLDDQGWYVAHSSSGIELVTRALPSRKRRSGSDGENIGGSVNVAALLVDSKTAWSLNSRLIEFQS
jgi:hypothetical protein